MTQDEKKWKRPWSTDEMIENAENWSLAGDVALLNSLKAFAENLFTKSASVSNNVDNLLHSLDEVSLKLNISQNELQSLRNKQFIESRVYEDDETLDIKEDVKSEVKVLSEEEKEKLVKESVQEGLNVMNKYFEKIQVSISDSEDEESDKSYILRPKDLYGGRPLPMVIGTDEWYKKWHVGLADSSGESESEKVSEAYSDSESGDDLPKDLIKGSETSSELDYSSRTSENRPVANSTFNDSVRRPDKFTSDDESEGQGSLPVKTPISSQSFAEQLAAKLGNVISEREDISSEINKNPIQPSVRNKFAGDLFSDEPPPLDNMEDTILPKSAQQGLFSGGQGLFDDNDDDFWDQPTKEEPSRKSLNVSGDSKPIAVKPEEKLATNVASFPKSSQVSKGLFDSDSDSGEDIFVSKLKQPTKLPFLQPYTTTAPLFDEEPPEIEAPKTSGEDTLKKKPIGGVSIFGKSDLFSGENFGDILKSRKQDNVTRSEPKQSDLHQNTAEENVKIKKLSLFDDTEEEEDGVVQTIPNKPKKISLFDDDDEDINVNDSTSNVPQSKNVAQNIQTAKLESPFNNQEEEKIKTTPNKPQKISLFDDDEIKKPEQGAKSKKVSLFDDDDDLFKDDLFSTVASKKFTSNLFDDLKDDDLFSEKPEKTNTSKVDLFEDLPEVRKTTTADTTPEKQIETKPKTLPDLLGITQEKKDRNNEDATTVHHKSEVTGTKDSVNHKISVTKDESTKILDEVDRGLSNIVLKLPEREVIGAEKLSTDKKVSKSLFEEDDQDFEATDTEDLFKNISSEEPRKTNLFKEEESSEEDKNSTTSPETVKKQTTQHVQTTDPQRESSNVSNNVPSKNTVNLFGSSPPPDDDDWDTKSEQFSDNEDQFSYRIDYNTAGSSLFDNEPPSLGPNESSGIVRDYNATRVETDDSSFYPYASSSRRFSSDIFNEQQSQDSFFVTKNKSDSYSIPPPLEKIPEKEKSSNLDITPSGNLEDLEATNSKDDSSVFQGSSKTVNTTESKPKKPVSLFDDIFDDQSDSEDLFSSVKKRTVSSKLSDKRLSLFDNVEDVLDVRKTNKGDANSATKNDSTQNSNQDASGEVKIDAANNSEEAVEEIRVTEEMKDIAGEDKPVPKPSGSPGKLKHNLKINVNALMPGSTPPKMRDIPKSRSMDLPESKDDTPTSLSSPDTSGFFTPTQPGIARDMSSSSSEKIVSFEDALDNVEVLRSVTKDRAKIPIKRRPSTRRGRQQAMQSSTKEFTLAAGSEIEVSKTESILSETEPQIVEPTVTNQDNPTSDLPNLADTPEATKMPSFRTPVEEITVPKPNISEDLKDDAHTRFSVVPEKKTETPLVEKFKSSIFDSDDSDGELFGDATAKKNIEPSSEAKQIVIGVKKTKKSLFNDSSSDDDLFSTTSSAESKRKVPKATEKKPQKSTTRKLENIEADEDPLSSLLK